MKLRGQLHGTPIIIFIDGGTSHNFIVTQVVEGSYLEVSQTPNLRIQLGDNHKMNCKGFYSDLSLLMLRVLINMDCYSFQLESIDLTFAIASLEKLGDV